MMLSRRIGPTLSKHRLSGTLSPSGPSRPVWKDPPPPSESLHQNHISYDGVHTLLYIQQLNSDTETFLPANIKRLKCRFVE